MTFLEGHAGSKISSLENNNDFKSKQDFSLHCTEPLAEKHLPAHFLTRRRLERRPLRLSSRRFSELKDLGFGLGITCPDSEHLPFTKFPMLGGTCYCSCNGVAEAFELSMPGLGALGVHLTLP